MVYEPMVYSACHRVRGPLHIATLRMRVAF